MTEAVRPVLIMRPAAESCKLGRGHKRIMCNNDKVSTYNAHTMIVEDTVNGSSGWRP